MKFKKNEKEYSSSSNDSISYRAVPNFFWTNNHHDAKGEWRMGFSFFVLLLIIN